MRSRRITAITSALLMVIYTQALADTNHKQAQDLSVDNEMLFASGQTVSTATRTGQSVADSPSAVTVITAADIRKTGATSIIDVLRYVPGLDVSEQNNGVTNVSIRGFNQQFSNSLLVMVDGRPIYNDLFGGVFWDTLPVMLSQISRIEIVRGPGSALYGADAFEGVINIITKNSKELAKAQKLHVMFMEGTHRFSNDEMLLSGAAKNGASISLGVQYDASEGYGSPAGVHDRSQAPLLTLDAQTPINHGSSIRFQAGHTDTLQDFYQQLYLGNSSFHNNYASLTYSETGKSSPVSSSVSYTTVSQNSGSVNYGKVGTLDADIHQQRNISSQSTLVYGADDHYITANSAATAPVINYRNNVGVYLQDEIHFHEGYTLFAGLRYDSNSQYGSDLTPRISLVKHLPHKQTVRLSYSNAFQAPTIINSFVNAQVLLAPGLNAAVTGNTKINPQTINSYELGWHQSTNKGYRGVNLFYNTINNFIGASVTGLQPSPPYPPQTPSTFSYTNQGNVSAYGIEFEGASWLSHSLEAIYNYSYECPHQPALSQISTLTPMHMANLELDDSLGSRWDLFLGSHLVGAQSNGAGAVNSVPAYFSEDLRVAYHLSDAGHPWTLSFIVQNLLGGNHLEYPVGIATGLPPQTDRQPTTFYVSVSGGF